MPSDPSDPVEILAEGCLYCPYVATALSVGALFMAMQDHADYVNIHANQEDDPHFEEIRLDKLIAS